MNEIKALELKGEELKDQNVLLSNLASLTRADFEFSALRSKTQNIEKLGKLFLTDKEMIFKGFDLEELSPIREPADKITCKLGKPFTLAIKLSDVEKIFVGHDETFGRRHQILSKLRITVNSDNLYFILFDDDLVSAKEKVHERTKEWKVKIEELSKAKEKEIVTPKIAMPKPKVIEPVIAVPNPVIEPVPKPIIAKPEKAPEKPITKPIAKPTAKPIAKPILKPIAKPISSTEPIETATSEEVEVELSEDLLPNIARLKKVTEAKKEGKDVPEIPKVAPLKPKKPDLKVAVKPKVKEKTATEILREEEERLKPKFKVTKVKAYEGVGASYTPLKASMKPISTKINDEDSAIDKVLGDIREEMDIEILGTEFDSMTADTSINKCPFCGWLLAWDQHKCPKCKKDV